MGESGKKHPGKDAQIEYVISEVIALLGVLSHLKVFPLQFRHRETSGLGAQSDAITKRHYQGEAPKGLELQLSWMRNLVRPTLPDRYIESECSREREPVGHTEVCRRGFILGSSSGGYGSSEVPQSARWKTRKAVGVILSAKT